MEEANVLGRDVWERLGSKSSMRKAARRGIANHKGCHKNGK